LKFETIIDKIKYPPSIIQRAAVCFFSCDFQIKLEMILVLGFSKKHLEYINSSFQKHGSEVTKHSTTRQELPPHYQTISKLAQAQTVLGYRLDQQPAT
jgi:hypothetical protein